MRPLSLAACLVLVGCFNPGAAPGEGEETDGTTDGTGDSMSGSSAGTTPGTTVSGSATSPATTMMVTTSPDDTGTTTDDTMGETVAPPEMCADGAGLCVSTPDGWNGPVAAALADAPGAADCGALEAAVTGQAAIDAPASCTCTCGDPTGASCDDALLESWAGDNTCAGAAVFSQVLLPPGMGDPCNFMPGGVTMGEVPVDAASYWTLTTESAGGSCAPAASQDIPDPSYGQAFAGCAVQELDMGCDGGESCYEAPDGPYEPGLCVWQAGDHECPGEGYAERTVIYQGPPTDTRSCSGCSCGGPTGSCPGTTADIFEGYYCNDAALVVGEACVEVCHGPGCQTYAISALLDIGPVVAECEPSGGDLIGELTETDPVTVCCTPS